MPAKSVSRGGDLLDQSAQVSQPTPLSRILLSQRYGCATHAIVPHITVTKVSPLCDKVLRDKK